MDLKEWFEQSHKILFHLKSNFAAYFIGMLKLYIFKHQYEITGV